MWLVNLLAAFYKVRVDKIYVPQHDLLNLSEIYLLSVLKLCGNPSIQIFDLTLALCDEPDPELQHFSGRFFVHRCLYDMIYSLYPGILPPEGVSVHVSVNCALVREHH